METPHAGEMRSAEDWAGTDALRAVLTHAMRQTLRATCDLNSVTP